MLPDIDSIALFVKAAEHGNLTRAAEASHITVPAASRRLAMLEHQLDARLFERHSRGIELTPAGEHLLTMARELIAQVQHLRAEMRNYASGQRAVLRVHGNTSAMAQFLPGDVARFQTDHEDIRLVLEECWSEEAVRRVRSGEADLGVIVSGTGADGLWCCPYRTDRLAAVMRTDDDLYGESIRQGDEISFTHLMKRDLVGLEGGSSLTRLLAAHAEQLGQPLVLRVQVRSFEAVCRSVQASLGIGVLPLAAARHYVDTLQLAVVPLADDWAHRTMRLVLRSEQPSESALGALTAHLHTCAVSDTASY